MREILFRGKSSATKEWVEGYFYKKKFYRSDTALCSYITVPHPGLNRRPSDNILVIPETVGQFTGLTDKNGKKIFEGDIVDCWSEGINAQGAVQQRVDGLWIIYPAWQKSTFWGLCPNANGSTSVKIIGNIHDNGDLLKGGAE